MSHITFKRAFKTPTCDQAVVAGEGGTCSLPEVGGRNVPVAGVLLEPFVFLEPSAAGVSRPAWSLGSAQQRGVLLEAFPAGVFVEPFILKFLEPFILTCLGALSAG